MMQLFWRILGEVAMRNNEVARLTRHIAEETYIQTSPSLKNNSTKMTN